MPKELMTRQLPDESHLADIEPIDVVNEDMLKYMGWPFKPTDTHFEILECMKAYVKHNEKFMRKGYLAPGVQARVPLLKLWHLVRRRRKEIMKDLNKVKAQYAEGNKKNKEHKHATKERLQPKNNQQ